MAADEANRLDSAILLRSAIWAGDWEFARKQALSLQGVSTSTPHLRSPIPPVFFDKYASKFLSRLERAPVADGIDSDLALRGAPLDGEGIPRVPILAGRNLRAVVSHTSSIDFVMRGYLTNLAWEAQLREACRAAMAKYPPYREYEPSRAIPAKVAPTLEDAADEAEWIMEGRLQRIVSVDLLGLIVVEGRWTGGGTPRLGAVFDGLRTVLRLLDGNTRRDSET
jgi:hypothetical protein